MLKRASKPPYWESVKKGLSRISNLDPKIKQLLGQEEKIKFHRTTPPDNSSARAYVTTEDTDDNGSLDTINIVITNIENDIGQETLAKLNGLKEDDPLMQSVVSAFAEILTHEAAHLKDYNHETGEFPGGEGVAESAASSFKPQFVVADLDSISRLLKLANHLDSLGEVKLADKIDNLLNLM